MPSRRELIQMTEEEQRAFLDEQKTITIVSNNHIVFMAGVYVIVIITTL